MNRKYLYVAGAVALGAIAAWLWKRSRPTGTVEVGAAAPSVPYSTLPVSGEHETINGVETVGVFGLDWS